MEKKDDTILGVKTRVVQAIAVAAATAVTGILVGFVTNINTNMSDVKGQLSSLQNRYDERTSASLNEIITMRANQEKLRSKQQDFIHELARLHEKASSLDNRVLHVLTLSERIGQFDSRLAAIEKLATGLQEGKILERFGQLKGRLEAIETLATELKAGRLVGRMEGLDERLKSLKQLVMLSLQDSALRARVEQLYPPAAVVAPDE